MSKLLDQLIAETGIELHSSRYDVAAAMIERELQAKWDAGYEACKAQHVYEPRPPLRGKFTPGPPDGGDLGIGTGILYTHECYGKREECPRCNPAKQPSAADLDAVADEQKAKEATE